jgi:hypothetical protein
MNSFPVEFEAKGDLRLQDGGEDKLYTSDYGLDLTSPRGSRWILKVMPCRVDRDGLDKADNRSALMERIK